ncbi:MAG: hypothetical protein PVI71_09180 [Desulfobacterales bacterium]|jgi:hypothetical protein
MKAAIKILIIILLLVTAIIAIHDYFAFKEKQKLFEQSVLIDEELVAFSKVLIEMQQLGEKYMILKSKKIDDESRESLLKEIEDFLGKSEKITAKFSEILTNYNSIAVRYNDLPHQILLFKNSLPPDLKIKTREDYLSM